MSLDAIQAVSDAEAQAKRLKAAAEAEGRRAAAEAEAQGQAAVTEALAQAAADLEKLRAAAVEAADSAERELRSNTESDKAALRTLAGQRLEQAAKLIVERIVG